MSKREKLELPYSVDGSHLLIGTTSDSATLEKQFGGSSKDPLNIKWQTFPFLGIYSSVGNYDYTKPYIWIYIATLFIVFIEWKHPICSSTDE